MDDCCNQIPCEITDCCGNQLTPIVGAKLYEPTPDGPITIADGIIFGDRFYGIAPPAQAEIVGE